MFLDIFFSHFLRKIFAIRSIFIVEWAVQFWIIANGIIFQIQSKKISDVIHFLIIKISWSYPIFKLFLEKCEKVGKKRWVWGQKHIFNFFLQGIRHVNLLYIKRKHRMTENKATCISQVMTKSRQEHCLPSCPSWLPSSELCEQATLLWWYCLWWGCSGCRVCHVVNWTIFMAIYLLRSASSKVSSRVALHTLCPMHPTQGVVRARACWHSGLTWTYQPSGPPIVRQD